MNLQQQHCPTRHLRITKQLGLLVIVSAVIMIVYKMSTKSLNPVKMLLFVNSLIINDLSLRYGRLLSLPF